jgi:hypothetical protein
MYDGKIQADLQDQALTRENIIKAAIGNSVDDETAVKEGA